jgi:IclR family KDG regulon transcriptional repressor
MSPEKARKDVKKTKKGIVTAPDRKAQNLATTEILKTNSTFRTMCILESLAGNQGSTLEELAPIVELSRPTLFRFLQVLVKMGYVEKNQDNRYFLTPKLFTVASRSLPETELSRIAQPYMEDMSYRTGETSILSILDGNSALYLIKIESKYNRKFYERIGKKVPLYCTSGKILLAGMDDETLDRYFATEKLIPYTEKTITDEAELRKQIAEIREKGYSISDSEYESGHRSIAAPIYDHEHKVIASLSITWPMFRETSEKFISGLEYLLKVAKQISKIMGCFDI